MLSRRRFLASLGAASLGLGACESSSGYTRGPMWAGAGKLPVIVVGGGMAGCAAAHYLAKMGARAIVFERDRIARDLSMHGGAELAYRWGPTSPWGRDEQGDDLHAALAARSLEGWRAIERETQIEILRENGLLVYGDAAEETKALLEKHHVPFESLDAEQMAKRWAVKPKTPAGLFEKTSGALWADRALAAFRKSAAAGGVVFREGESVVGYERLDRETIRVRTSKRETAFGSSLVLAAGAWTNDLLAHQHLRLDLEIGSMLWGHYAVDPAAAGRFPQWLRLSSGGSCWGFPAHEGRIRVAVDGGARAASMASFVKDADAKRAGLLDELLHDEWDGVKEKVALQCSPFAVTRDESFVLDVLPGEPPIAIFCGERGQGFRFAPVIGQSLAELATGRRPTVETGPLSVARPAAGLTRI
ncbi:MAG: FAD-dependent oxidoreductase [Labilithrix sp.]|nr:FAD-dependent oxidoreductase [Labilithrix sp.]